MESRAGHLPRAERPDGPIAAIAAVLAMLLVAPLSSAAEIDIGAPFTLTDQNGRTRRDTDFRGAWMLIYFGYTYCPDTCPTALLKMTAAVDLLAQRDPAKAARVVPIFITIDPARDTPALLKDYAGSFTPHLVALTGKPDALRDLAYAYGVFFAKEPGGGDTYLIDHTSFIYLMGPDGRYVSHFEKDVTQDQLADVLAAQIVTNAAQR